MLGKVLGRSCVLRLCLGVRIRRLEALREQLLVFSVRHLETLTVS